jgi:hypothetical protein
MASPSGIVHYLFSREDGPTNYLIARWLFLRSLGLIYFSAFFALLFQIRGLIGAQGILPATSYLQRLHVAGAERFWYAPSFLWLGSSDHALMALTWIGLIASVLVVLNLIPRPALIVCFLSFLSFIAVSQDFGQYQSDGMLLEAGFLALFLAPFGLRPGLGRRWLASRAASFLLLWEWFRIYFESGIVKLASGDPTWRNLTAMYEYYQNGPLPTWIGWYLQHLPHWFQKGTAGLTLFMELVLVFMAFIPRRGFRIATFVIVTIWQIGVISTANYAFLNYLVLVLAFLLLDDQAYLRLVPDRWRSRIATVLNQPTISVDEPAIIPGSKPADGPVAARPVRRSGLGMQFSAICIAVTAVCLTLIAYVTTAELVQILDPTAPLPVAPILALEPFRIANSYGLFAVMTPHRYEIEFQGSNDGVIWTPYPFRYKPQDPSARPRIYAPYQPRFDWNLWFASLGTWQDAPIVPLTEQRLLEGSQPVLGLFAENPFPNQPPKMVRAVLYQYWFSTPEEKRTQHIWWTRQLLGTYAPTFEREPDGRYAITALPSLEAPPAVP